MNPIDFLTDLFNPDLAFLPKALAVAVMSSIVCGVVGTFVVLRGMAFIGDAVAHAVFPGLAVAFVVGGNLVLGGTVAGILTAVLVAVFSQNRRIKEDSIIGVFFVAAFALGIVIISQAPGYAGSLQQFLFGSITGIPDSDLYVVGVTGLVVLAVVFLLHKEFVTISLDRESARAMGVKVFWLDLALYILVTLAVVISVQTIGNILVLALLITPAATARLLTDRLGVMMLLAPVIGGAAALVGLYVSWSWDLPTGGTIVLILTVVFLLAWFLSPRQGVIAKTRHRRTRANRVETPSTPRVRATFDSAPGDTFDHASTAPHTQPARSAIRP
ncbi:anchored repeat-type ABC transporter permease subunit [Microbacterium marinilacus]|uniref:Anchored repeat-type ABC transporter permease subunit n=2 Tax=Microbacterium marinilacus TaxID=415209 RepID=A0ABP7BI66_9MICO|nr:anchored repeat-type ABC transporter permease subunit [Microbacterium marinilacus]